MINKTTHYRRQRRAKELGCSIDELPDNRGKHGNHAKASKAGRWNGGAIISTNGYRKIRVGVSHPIADPNGYAYEHHLVWFSAGNQPLIYGEVIHHINGDKSDNRIENLSKMDIPQHNLEHGKTKLNDADVYEIRRLFAAGFKQKDIAKEFGVVFQTISKIVHGEKRKNVKGPIITEDCRKKSAVRILDGRTWDQLPKTPQKG